MRNRISQKRELKRCKSLPVEEYKMSPVAQEVRPHIEIIPDNLKEFIFIEFNRGKPTQRLLSLFVTSSQFNKKVIDLFRTK
jgi:hypothetical protein